MPKRVLEAPTVQERAKQRQKLGSLKDLTVQPATRKRYTAALQHFFAFLKRENLELPTRRILVDPLVSEYLEHLWSTGLGRGLACDTLASLQDSDPRLRGQLPQSWRLLKAWHQNEIPNRAPPLPEALVKALVGWSWFKGYFTFGVSLLVGFYGMLRTGEILNIRTSHVQSSASGDKVYLSLGLTKGGKRAGASESVVLGYEQVVKALLRWTKAKGSCNLCGSPAFWRARFAEGLKALGLESFGFRPYSLRRGGATYWFGRHQNLDRLLIQGRWLTQKSARIYINEGLAILASMKFEHLHAKLRPFSLFYFSEQSCFTVPPLEPPVPGRAGGRGKKRRIMRTQKRREKYFSSLEFQKLASARFWSHR